jgi:hypothetical protein
MRWKIIEKTNLPWLKMKALNSVGWGFGLTRIP